MDLFSSVFITEFKKAFIYWLDPRSKFLRKDFNDRPQILLPISNEFKWIN